MDEREARGGVLVLGGGFAGAYVARLLGTRGATIVSPENFMLFTPLLPEAASGTLEPRHVVVPLRLMCPHAELPLGAISRVLPIPGLAEHGLGFKSLADAIHLRNHVLRRLEAAAATQDEEHRRRELGFVFVGAGYAGVEAFAELSDLV